jgi:hypothetical protein
MVIATADPMKKAKVKRKNRTPNSLSFHLIHNSYLLNKDLCFEKVRNRILLITKLPNRRETIRNSRSFPLNGISRKYFVIQIKTVR